VGLGKESDSLLQHVIFLIKMLSAVDEVGDDQRIHAAKLLKTHTRHNKVPQRLLQLSPFRASFCRFTPACFSRGVHSAVASRPSLRACVASARPLCAALLAS